MKNDSLSDRTLNSDALDKQYYKEDKCILNPEYFVDLSYAL